MSSRSRRSLLAFGAVVLVLTASPGLATAGAHGRGATAARIDYSTFAFDSQRTGYNPREAVLAPGNVGNLKLRWSYDMGTLTNAQTLFARGVNVAGTPTDIVYVGGHDGNVLAVNANTGQLVWKTFTGISLADRCGGPYGIDGTPVIDRSTNRIYSVGGDDKAYAMDLSTGAILSGWPVVVTTNTPHEHVWSAVALSRKNLYVSVASYCDKGPYNGKIFLISTTNPSVTKEWFVIDPSVHPGGGIWGPGGVSINPLDTNLYTTTGNALGEPENLGYAEHIVRLNWKLDVLASNYPGLEGGNDLDFASTPVLYRPPGCPLMAAAKNKNGELLVYNTDDIESGPVQRLQIAGADSFGSFQGDVAYFPVANMVYAANSITSDTGEYTYGLLGFNVQPDCTMSLAWGTPLGIVLDVTTSPMVANGVVYYSDGSGNQVLALDAVSGTVLWTSGSTITGAIYQAPTIVNGRLYVGTRDNHLYAFGLGS